MAVRLADMLWTLVAAAAATPLVHDTGGDDVVARAREAGVTEELEPVGLDVVRESEPWSRNGQPVGPCSPGSIDAGAVRGHLLYGELEAARERLAAERVRCDGSAADRAELERAAGLLALATGEEAQAAEAFAVAKAYDASLSWDDGFPAEQRAVFDAAEPLAASLLVAPAAARIDGAPPTGEPLAAGPHGILVGSTSVYLRHSDIDDVLVVPAAFPDRLPALTDEGARRDLTHVLSAALGSGQRVYVAGPDALWSGTTGRTDWSPTPWPSLPEPEPVAVAVVKPSPAPWVVAGAGGVLALAGGVLTGVSAAQGQGLASDMQAALDEGDRAAFDALSGRTKGTNGRFLVGQGLLAGGAGVAAVGLVWGATR